MTTSLFRSPTPVEAELYRQRLELRRRRATLTARELELGDLRGQIESFEGRYLRQVGILLKQLDGWEEKIAELHVKHNMTEASGNAFVEPGPEPVTAAEPMRLDLRALFRELAKRIHPDFAADAHDERRRTRLMAQANDAFTRADIRSLQRMLDGFDVPPLQATPAAELQECLALLREVQDDIITVEAELEALRQSDTAKLQQRVIAAALEGRDLLAEMAVKIKGRIGMAMREYELDLTRIKNPSKGPRVEELLSAETKPKRPPVFDPMARVWKK